MTDQARLILAPAGWAHTPDSVQIRADCGCQCWISPVNMTHLLNPFMKTTTVCMPHVVQDREVMATLKRQGKAYAFPGTREEMVREIGQEETDKLWEHWGIEERMP